MEKSKAEKSPWVKKRKKWPKEERNNFILPNKEKKTLPKATKAVGFAKRLRQSKNDPEPAKILGASTLKIKVSTSAGCEHVLSESGGSDEKQKKNVILTALNTGALSLEMSSIDSLLVKSLAAFVKAKG